MDSEILDQQTREKVDLARQLFDAGAPELGLSTSNAHLWYAVREGLLEAVRDLDESRYEIPIMSRVPGADRARFMNVCGRIYRIASRIPIRAASDPEPARQHPEDDVR